MTSSCPSGHEECVNAKACRREAGEEARRLRRRDLTLQRTHGITLKQYEEILEYQGGICPICEREPFPDEVFTVDHDHGSKPQEVEPFVRGVVCRGCNRFVIGRHRDGDKLIRAGLYLNDPPALHVLPEHIKYPTRKKRQPRKRQRGKRNG